MNKKSLDLLEKVFEAEIEGAVTTRPGLYQTKSKLARELVEDGYLDAVEIILGGRFPVIVQGYRLTELGRITYCTSV